MFRKFMTKISGFICEEFFRSDMTPPPSLPFGFSSKNHPLRVQGSLKAMISTHWVCTKCLQMAKLRWARSPPQLMARRTRWTGCRISEMFKLDMYVWHLIHIEGELIPIDLLSQSTAVDATQNTMNRMSDIYVECFKFVIFSNLDKFRCLK